MQISTKLVLSPTTQLPASGTPSLVYLASLGEGSRRTMAQSLDAIAQLLSSGKCLAADCPWWMLRYQHTAALRSILKDKHAPATANKMLSALKGVLRECWRLNLIPVEDYHRAIDLKSIKSQKLPAGRALTSGELSALMSVCCEDCSAIGYRDAALLSLLAAGLRRSEVVALSLSDFNAGTGEVRVIGGKGRKDRITYTPVGGVEAIADWLEVRGSLPGALLCEVNKGGRLILNKYLADQSVLDILLKRAGQAGITDISPHDFRRTFISNLLDLGADISTVAKLAGHSSPDTTARYDRRGEVAKRKAVSLLHLPYRRKKAPKLPLS